MPHELIGKAFGRRLGCGGVILISTLVHPPGWSVCMQHGGRLIIVAPFHAVKGSVLFLLGLTLVLGMHLPVLYVMLLPKVPFVDSQTALSTIMLFHTALSF